MKKVFFVLLIVISLTLASVSFADLSGTINIVGSTSVQPLAEELAKVFMEKNKNVKVFIQGGGSGVGIKAAMEETADIGTSSRELTPEETGLHETMIAKDGIAMIVNKSNSLNNLTNTQLQKIYSGEYTNWNQNGGPNQAITVVNREPGSGTRTAFEDLVLGKLQNTNKSLVQSSTEAVQQTVAVTKNAIGYISLGSLDTKIVKAVTMDGVKCTKQNILNKKYKLQRPFLLLTKKAPTGLVKTFIDWILSPEAQKIVAKDYIAVKSK